MGLADELSGPDLRVADMLLFQRDQACLVVGVGDDSETVRTDGIIRVIESSPVQVVDHRSLPLRLKGGLLWGPCLAV
jgi:hypothetical protein